MSAFYVYVAGPMSGTPAEYLANCHRLSKLSRELIDAGFCPINPAADILEGLMSEDLLSDGEYKRRSLDLLRLLEGRRAAVLVAAVFHRNGERSAGVDAEIAEAQRLQIPVCLDAGALLRLRAES